MIPDEQEATARALEMAEAGDLVLVLADNVKRSWKQIIYFNSGAKMMKIPRKNRPWRTFLTSKDLKLTTISKSSATSAVCG